MKTKRFRKEEAQSKVGKRVETLRELPDVPLGSWGTVVEIDDMGGGECEWDVVIEWDVKVFPPLIVETPDFTFMRSGKPIRDWYTKDEYEIMLREVDTTTN